MEAPEVAILNGYTLIFRVLPDCSVIALKAGGALSYI